MASESIRDRRLSGARLPAAKKETAIMFFADNLPATKVAKIVGISLDSARAIRDREQKQIMNVRQATRLAYYFLWEQDVEAYFNREAEKEYQELWQEILKKQKALNLSPAPANSSRPHAS